MSKIFVSREFSLAIQINHVCNLTCSGCATLNHINFRGHYRLKDREPYLEKWSKIADFEEISIVGGEPYLSPDLVEYGIKVRELWPNAEIDVSTNGTLLFLDKNIEKTKELIKQNILIKISCHSLDHLEKIEQSVHKILDGCDRIEEVVTPMGQHRKDYFKGSQRVFMVTIFDNFFEPWYKELKDGTVYLHGLDNDPVASYNSCLANCLTMIDKFLFTCALTSTYFAGKHQFKYEEHAKELLDQYVPCSPDDDIESIKQWFDNLGKPIAQCSLCAMDKRERPNEIWVPIKFDKSLKKFV